MSVKFYILFGAPAVHFQRRRITPVRITGHAAPSSGSTRRSVILDKTCPFQWEEGDGMGVGMWEW